MSGRLRGSTGHERRLLTDGWECGAAGAEAVDWLPAAVPGTVAGALRSAGRWSLDGAARSFDAETWSYRVRFAAPPAASGERVVLGLEGLATLATVVLNGHVLGESNNMFLAHEFDVGALLVGDNELTLHFGSLDAWLRARRPRPRWRVPMLEQQQLRWVRTSLLGRTPGWSPPVAPLGPWRPVWLERRRAFEIDDLRLAASVVGRRGLLSVSCVVTAIDSIDASVNPAAVLHVVRGDRRCVAPLAYDAASGRLAGCVEIDDVELWWPHTHGEPVLYDVQLTLGAVEVDLGRVGFRTLVLDRSGGSFSFLVNGRAIFCRGACWTPLDCVSLQASAADTAAALERVRAAGMNMLRLPGPLLYETDTFLDLCDAMGILIWQDFMFANMDYPAADPAFAASVAAEAAQQLARLQARPALALLCGNSEGAQQAAMAGAPRDCWAPPLFERDLADWSREWCAEVPYCPSSSHGGAFPFAAHQGASSYYGVGAYLLPLSDARRSEVRFASECLAFANVPEPAALGELARGEALRCHHARWKERVPRDRGAGWDFDDVRDHYVKELFRLEPLALRYADHDRYLRLARVASGEIMAATLQEWRRAESRCAGALIWFLRDLWPGAGWGVLDALGSPKAAYYYLKRALQPLTLFVTDEGTNGLVLHVVNEAPRALSAWLDLRLYRASEPVGLPVGRRLALEPGGKAQLAATDLFEGFIDLSFAYRFGPPACDLLHARLLPDEPLPEAAAPPSAALAETFHFPLGLPNCAAGSIGLTGLAASCEGGYEVTVSTRQFAQSVHIEAPGFEADDQYFHLAPGSSRRVRLSGAANGLEATLHALNSGAVARLGRPA